MPLLSIIIPVYNVAPYLDDCLKSVVGQTYQDMEIICVDDGSSDGSGNILDSWKEKDNRIIVQHQSNKGVSSARNMGLKLAKGSYITFVDADDVVKSNIYTFSIEKIQQYHLDTFLFSFETFPNNQQQKTGFVTDKVVSYHQLFASNDKIQTMNSLCFNWRFIFKSSILKDNNLYFDEAIAIGEDMVYNVDAICHSERIMVSDEPLYLYRKNNANSAMSMKYKPQLEASLTRMYEIKQRQIKDYKLNLCSNYPYDLARYTILTYLRMLVQNMYNQSGIIDKKIELRRILSLPMIREAFDVIGYKDLYPSWKEYIFYLAQKYKWMTVVQAQYDKMYG